MHSTACHSSISQDDHCMWRSGMQRIETRVYKKNERENYREHTNAVDKSLYSNKSSRCKRLVIIENQQTEKLVNWLLIKQYLSIIPKDVAFSIRWVISERRNHTQVFRCRSSDIEPRYFAQEASCLEKVKEFSSKKRFSIKYNFKEKWKLLGKGWISGILYFHLTILILMSKYSLVKSFRKAS